MKNVLAITLLVVLLVQMGSAGTLRELYNSRVVRAERWERPLLRVLKHSGVVVTLENGQRYLVYKSNDNGEAGATVVVDAGTMSTPPWTMTESKAVSRSTVANYVDAGGRVYDFFLDNCHHASRRMMRLQ